MAISVPFDVTIREDTAGLNATTRGLREMGREADRANRTAQRGYDLQNDSLGRLRRNLLGVVGAYVSLHGAIRAISTIADFEEQLAFGGAVTGSQNLDVLGRRLRDIAQVSKFTALEVSRAFSFLGQTGFTEAQALQALPDTLRLAEIGLLDVADSADIASNVLKGFGLEVDALTRVTDVFASAVTSTNTDVRQLGDAMSYAAPTARVLGVSVESAAAAIGVLSDAGVQGERAGTAMRRILIQLNAAGYDLSNGLAPALSQLRDEGTDLARSTDLVGLRFAGFLQLLIDGSDDVERLTEQFNNAEGTAESLADTMAQNLRRAIDLTKSAFQELLFTIGDFLPLEEIFRNIADSLNFIARNAGGVLGTGGLLASPALFGAAGNFLAPFLGSFLGTGGLGRIFGARGGSHDILGVFERLNRSITGLNLRFGSTGLREIPWIHDLRSFGRGLSVANQNVDFANFNLQRGINSLPGYRNRAFFRARQFFSNRPVNSDFESAFNNYRDEYYGEPNNSLQRHLNLRSQARGQRNTILAAAPGLGVQTALRGTILAGRAIWQPVIAALTLVTAGLIAFNEELRRSSDPSFRSIGTSFGAFGQSLATVFGGGARQLGRSTVDFFNYIFGDTFEDFPDLLDTVLTKMLDTLIDFIDETARIVATLAAFTGTVLDPSSRLDANEAFYRQYETVTGTLESENRRRNSIQSLIDRRNYLQSIIGQAPDDVSRQSQQNQINTLNTQILTRFYDNPGFQRFIANINRQNRSPFGAYGPQGSPLDQQGQLNEYERYYAQLEARAERYRERERALRGSGIVTALTREDTGSFVGPVDRAALADQEAYLVWRDFGTPFRDLNERNRRGLRVEGLGVSRNPYDIQRGSPGDGRGAGTPTEEAEGYRDIIREINRELADSNRELTETSSQYEIQQRIREAIRDIAQQDLNLEEFRNALLQKRIELQQQQFREAREREIGAGLQTTGRILSNELSSYLNPDSETGERFRFSWSEFGYEAGQAFVDTFIDRVEEGFENMFEYLTKLANDYINDVQNEDSDGFSLGGLVRSFFGIDPNDYENNSDLPNVDTADITDVALENLTGRNSPAPGITINQAPITVNGGDPIEVQRVLRSERRTTIQQVQAINSRNERLGRS